jgi:hypothetical protein
MENQILTDQTLQSPRKTGGVLLAVTLITLGSAALILYLVKESRKKDEQELKELLNGEPVSVYQPESTTIGGLLQELTNFGNSGGSSAQSVPDDIAIKPTIGCNQKWNKLQAVDEFNPSSNINKCGFLVYEFQEMLTEFGYSTGADGRYGTSTLKAHKNWLQASN